MFKVLVEGCEPTRGSKYSACVDLRASEDVVIGAGETKLIPLGVCLDMQKIIKAVGYEHLVTKFLESHYLQLMLRSSLSKELIIANGVGVIDLDYRDEIMIRVHKPIPVGTDVTQLGTNRKFAVLQDKLQITKGDRVAQITLLEHKAYLFGIDTEDERTAGFGSTGVR